MSLSRLFFGASVFYLLLQNFAFSQTDSSKRWFHGSISAGIIINKTFSHFEKSDEDIMGLSGYYTKLSEAKNTKPYLPGYTIGLTSIFGKSQASNFIFGLSFSMTRAKYYKEEGSPSYGYSNTTIKTESTIDAKFLLCNVEAGYKFRLLKKIFLQPSLLLNNHIHSVQKESGIKTTTVDSNTVSFPNTRYRYQMTQDFSSTSKYQESFLSARLTLFYQFQISKTKYNIFVFRNFGLLGIKLPWWGLGLSLVY